MKELRLIKILHGLFVDGNQVIIYNSKGEKVDTIDIPKGVDHEKILKDAGFILIP